MTASRATWCAGTAIGIAFATWPAVIAQLPPPLPTAYTTAQASRGREVYTAECASCHGGRLNDGTAISLVGAAFLQKWSHPLITLDDLFYIVQTTMPKNKGNSLLAADYMAVTAYLLEQNGYPAGTQTRLATVDQRASVRLTTAGRIAPGELTGDFLVLDAENGKEAYRFNTGGPIGGGIVTYQIGGRQYVAVASGSPSSFWVDQNPGSPTVFLFALPAGTP